MEQQIQTLRERILDAIKSAKPLKILAGKSKSFYGRDIEGEPLDMTSYSGVISYEPTELFITARSGTPISLIKQTLADSGQMLAFEPPQINSNATIGGAIATGLSGPRRPYAGSVRDYVLGVRCMNGLGKDMSFGGQVMKNVAGYDLSRLMTGALGTLGVLLEISIKVLPLPEIESTCRKSMTARNAVLMMNELSGKSLPLSAACYDGKYLFLRLSGNKKVVTEALNTLDFDEYLNGEQWWQGLRDYTLPIFKSGKPLWRLSVPSTTQLDLHEEEFLIDWGGAQYWLTSDRPSQEIFNQTAEAGGSATLFRNGDHHAEVFQPLTDEIFKLHSGLKQSFDPHRILNPGKMFAKI